MVKFKSATLTCIRLILFIQKRFEEVNHPLLGDLGNGKTMPIYLDVQKGYLQALKEVAEEISR